YTSCNLLAFYLILKNNQKQFSHKAALFVCLLLFMGCLFKEPSIVIFLILIGYFLLLSKNELKKWLPYLIATPIIYFFIRLFIVQTPIRHPLYAPISEATLVERIMTIPSELVHYLTLVVYPQKLAVSQHFVIRSLDLAHF